MSRNAEKESIKTNDKDIIQCLEEFRNYLLKHLLTPQAVDDIFNRYHHLITTNKKYIDNLQNLLLEETDAENCKKFNQEIAAATKDIYEIINNLAYSLFSKTEEPVDDDLIHKNFAFYFFQNQDLAAHQEEFKEIFTRQNMLDNIREALDAEDEYTTSSETESEHGSAGYSDTDNSFTDYSEHEHSISGGNSDYSD